MKCVTYNVHFGVGMDGKYDLARIADAVRDADLIALQEVSRNNPQNGGADLVAGLCELLPGYFSVFESPYKINLGAQMGHAGAVPVWFEFGNMILSKTPVIASRNLLLPRRRNDGKLNLQRGALETVVDTPLGPIRFYNVHTDHVSESERMMQVAFLKERVLSFREEGGAVTGLSSAGFPELPAPEHSVLMGDFNFLPDSAEYAALCGSPEGRAAGNTDFIDVSVPAGLSASESHTWFDPAGQMEPKRIDYCFASASLAAHIGKAHVDEAAVGSDHRPVWFELG